MAHKHMEMWMLYCHDMALKVHNLLGWVPVTRCVCEWRPFGCGQTDPPHLPNTTRSTINTLISLRPTTGDLLSVYIVHYRTLPTPQLQWQWQMTITQTSVIVVQQALCPLYMFILMTLNIWWWDFHFPDHPDLFQSEPCPYSRQSSSMESFYGLCEQGSVSQSTVCVSHEYSMSISLWSTIHERPRLCLLLCS